MRGLVTQLILLSEKDLYDFPFMITKYPLEPLFDLILSSND